LCIAAVDGGADSGATNKEKECDEKPRQPERAECVSQHDPLSIELNHTV
jgi:hypothetical protein